MEGISKDHAGSSRPELCAQHEFFTQAVLLTWVLFNYWELLTQLLEWMSHTLSQVCF